MSLKKFHIIFIVSCVAMTLLVGGWGVFRYLRQGDSGALTLGLASLVSGGLLVIYGNWFLRKIRREVIE